ncbi:hypothetical protein BDF19DRAFT_447994 [Syncephalis fuscata]|nr:hypothetical protein BDF19DRAFT_447994 [Syncephalis fuscata]
MRGCFYTPSLVWNQLYGILFLVIGARIWPSVYGFYIAANAPHYYNINDPVPVYWNKVYPKNNLLALPLAYTQLPFVCQPSRQIALNANIGQRLAGDQLVLSDILLETDRNETCKMLCRQDVDAATVQQAIQLIRNNYMAEWFADELPGTHPWSNIMDKQKRYGDGFPLGYYDPLEDKLFIYNHFIFQILYERPQHAPNQRLIVGFEIYPKSVESASYTCQHDASIPGIPQQELNPAINGITYTYSVLWIEETHITWGRRWNNYLNYDNDKSIPVFSLINAFAILAIMVLIIAVIAIRVFEIHIPYIFPEDTSEQDEYNGWKLLHGNVFRPPISSTLLSILVGSGLQLFGSILGVLILGILGIVNPSYPGGLVTWFIIIYVLSGVISGYVSARLNSTLVEADWYRHAIRTATLVPGSLLALALLLNFFILSEHGANTLSFGSLITLFGLWLCIGGPATVIGAYIGNKRASFSHPVRVSAVQRSIPPPVWYMRTIPSALFAGIPSFGTIFLQEYLILHYLWSDRFYYFYGYTLASFLLLIITSTLVAVSMTYFYYDYRWWWRTFLFGGSVSIYIFGYAILYYLLRLRTTGFVPTLLYLVHTLAISSLIGIMLGSISLMTTYYFMRRIFKVVKVN